MRDTVDFGIDLGTTNSAIAVAEDGGVSVIKNNEGAEITPSAVWIPKEGHMVVGRDARNRAGTDPKNTATEFKQHMGQADAPRKFENAGTSLTAPQLSAEILKSLRTSAQQRGKDLPDCAVITVPAAFTLNQNQATLEAAELAGLGSACPLLPEPTAAAFAYGLDDRTESGYWLVFDFGGGTFDAAVVSKRDGELRVLNHAGDPYLGGKLIDWAVAERVLAPEIGAQLGFTDFHRGNEKWRSNFAVLKDVAEKAKVQLSIEDSTMVMGELYDERRAAEMFELTLTRDQLDAVAEPFYLRAINFCRTALTKAALDPGDIDRVLLVGGATLAPRLREMLADPRQGLGIELDLSLDPSTVVAAGAAIFASTVRRPRTAVPEPAPGEFVVSLVYEPRVSTRVTTVAGTLHSSSTMDWSGYGVTIANPDGRPPFRSARTAVNAKGAFGAEVDLDPHRTSRFTIELTDGTGAACVVSPGTFSITHGDIEFGGLTLGHSLGIQQHDRTFAPILTKDTPLPKSHTEPFFTTGALSRNDTTQSIRIPLVQGERRRADRNREVGVLEIRPRDLTLDLPRGTRIEITFYVNASNLLTVTAYVPLLDTQFEAEIDMAGVRAQAPEVLEVLLVDTQERMESLRPAVARADAAEARRRLALLDEESAIQVAREQVRAATVDPSAAKYAEDRLQDVQAELDDIEDLVQVTELAQKVQDALNEAENLVAATGSPSDREELAALTERAHEAIRAQDATAMRAQLDRIVALVVELERRTLDWPVKLFYSLKHELSGSREAAALLAEGDRAVNQGDMRALDDVNRQLVRMLQQGRKTTGHSEKYGVQQQP